MESSYEWLQRPIGPVTLGRLGKLTLIEEDPKESLVLPGLEAGLNTRVCTLARRAPLGIQSSQDLATIRCGERYRP